MFSEVIIWGWPLHSHTHSYIHNAFFRAFEHLGYKTRWMSGNTSMPDKSIAPDTLFITEGQVDGLIPIRNDCFYLTHNCDGAKYKPIPKGRHILLQVFTWDRMNDTREFDGKFIRFNGEMLVMPWATDLLPHEIDENIEGLSEIISKQEASDVLAFVGYKVEPWPQVEKYCREKRLSFLHTGGVYDGSAVSVHSNIKAVQEAAYAPAFQSEWQHEHGYIPCRIFKNISYGAVGITTNKAVNEILQPIFEYITFRPTMTAAMDAIRNARPTFEQRVRSMEFVRDHHTYINRINTIVRAFESIRATS